MARVRNPVHFIGQCLLMIVMVAFIVPINTEPVLAEDDELANNSADGLRARVRARRSQRRWRSHQSAAGVMMSDARSSGLSSGLVRCGGVEIDPRGALCCDEIVYSRRPGSDMRCCGRIAYNYQQFACCGPTGRKTVVHRSPVMPVCCDERSNVECSPAEIRDANGLGSVCCRTPPDGDVGAGWRCCLRSDGCCDGATETIDIPGYRPACCQEDTDTAARCCAQTYERVGLLPQCCDDDRLRPICCKRPGGSVRCCPANVGYCCGMPGQERFIPGGRQSDAAGSQSAGVAVPQPRTGGSRRDERTDRRQQPDRRYDTRDRYDDRDRYPPVRAAETTTQRPRNSTTLHSIPASCCNDPSPRCCPPSSSSRRQPACCRPVCCRPASFSAACCPRQNPGHNNPCPPGQGGAGNPCCPGGQGAGADPCCPPPGQGNPCPCPDQGAGGGNPCCPPPQGSGNPCCPGQESGGNPCCPPGQGAGGGGTVVCCPVQGDTGAC